MAPEVNKPNAKLSATPAPRASAARSLDDTKLTKTIQDQERTSPVSESTTDAAETAVPSKAAPNHVMGFFEGFVREGTETVAGLYTLVTTNPITTAKGLVYMVTNPAQAVQAITEPYTTAYKDGRYGELAGRVGFQVLTVVLTSGALKSKEAAKAAKPTQTMTQAASQVTDDFARHIGAKKAVKELAGSSLKGAAYNKRLASLTAQYADEAAVRLAQRGLADKLATSIAASGLGDDAVSKIMAAGGKNVGASQAYRYSAQALKIGMKPEQIAAEIAKHGVSKSAAAQLPVATKLLMTQGPNAALIAGAANVKTAEAIAAQMKKLERLASTSTDKALQAGYKSQLDALKAATAANPRTGKLVDAALKGQKIGRFERVGAAMGSSVDDLGQVGEKIADKGRAVRNVLDAPKTVGDYARVIGSVPVAVGAALDAAWEGTVATLRKGLELIPTIRLPDVSWKAISKIRVPSPWELITAPVTVPLGTVGWALKNPGRALGALSLMGTTGNVAKSGEYLQARKDSDLVDADKADPGVRYYELRDGDTLEEIARRELGDPARWEEIYQVNRELFDSLGEDGVIAVGTKIRLPGAAAETVPTADVEGSDPAQQAESYKAALLSALDAELASAEDEETKAKLLEMKDRIAGMDAPAVLDLRPKLEEQGIVVEPLPPSRPPEAVGPSSESAGPAPTEGPTSSNSVEASAPSAPPKPAAPPPPPTPHQVRPGDTLWDISGDKLGDPLRWRELVEQNAKSYPSLADNPDYILPGWKLNLPGISSPATPATPAAPTTPATPVASNPPPSAKEPVAVAPVESPAPAPAPVIPAPVGEQREALTKQFNLVPGTANFDRFWREVSAYPTGSVGPDTGTDEDRRGLQNLLQKLGYDVPVSGDYFVKDSDGKPKLDESGNPASPTAEAVMHFKTLAGLKQTYDVLGADGKPVADINEYVDDRVRETMQVSLRLLQSSSLRDKAIMEATVREAARLQASAIGPEVGSREARQLVQQYLDALGYQVPVSGTFEESTLDALLDFKRKNGIAAGFKDDKGDPVYTPYVDGRTADALLNAIQVQAGN
ncbi:MAG: peptidoglycan-binding protein [Candidatus Sericytochromatia bacterium]|nr:peptidoglycan-binding protein [Candidatus Sericytochromatia bacterium]